MEGAFTDQSVEYLSAAACRKSIVGLHDASFPTTLPCLLNLAPQRDCSSTKIRPSSLCTSTVVRLLITPSEMRCRVSSHQAINPIVDVMMITTRMIQIVSFGRSPLAATTMVLWYTIPNTLLEWTDLKVPCPCVRSS